MNEQHVKEVFSDKAFVTELLKLDTAEEAQKALKEKGVDMSVEELNKVRDHVLERVNENGELSLEAMDEAAGGSVLGIIGVSIAGAALVVGIFSAVDSALHRRGISW